jgi:uncharacterized protein (DUF1778 family)
MGALAMTTKRPAAKKPPVDNENWRRVHGVKLDEDEYTEIATAAVARHMTFSAFMRAVALDAAKHTIKALPAGDLRAATDTVDRLKKGKA